MKHRAKYLILTLSALALLSGCDDKDSTGGAASRLSNWIDGGQSSADLADIVVPGGDYIRETESGNYLAARFAQYRQDWKTANQYLDRLIKLDPGNLDLQQRSMVLAMQAGDFNHAVAMARKVAQAQPDNLLAQLFVGSGAIAAQDYAQAEKAFSKMPKNNIGEFIKPILLAWIGAAEKKPDDDTLIANGPLHAYHALLIADYMGKVKDGEKYFIHVVTGGGADRHILEMMADIYNRQGKTDLAKKIYDSLLAQGAEGISSRDEEIIKKRDNTALAKARLETPAQGMAEAYYNMARILIQDQSGESALVFARLAQYLDPAKEDVKMLLATIMIDTDHPQDAIAFYKSVKPGTPGYPESMRSVAELLERGGAPDQAAAFLEERYAAEKQVDYLIQIGDIYRRQEKHQDAIKAYNRAMDVLGGKVSSDHWNLLYARGMSYERAGDFKKAENDLEAALEFRPEHPYLLNYLGYSWADQGKKLDKARELLEKAVALKPDDGYIIDSLGWVYYRTGDYEQATSELERAVELVPYDATINDHLGDAYWRVGRKSEARFQWQRALNHSKDDKQKAELSAKIEGGLGNIAEPAMKQAKTSLESNADKAAAVQSQ